MVKKYLLGSIAAMATMMFATSCSNEDAFDSAQDINVAKYEAKFIQKFGKPSPTQTWGFGNTSSSTRAITVAHVFPTAPAAEAYKSSTTLAVESYINGGGDHAIGSSTTGVNLYSQGNIYVVGNSSPSSFYVAGNSNVYITNGATLNIGNGGTFSYGQNQSAIYVAQGGTLNITGGLEMSQTKIYNKGTVNVSGDFWASNTGVIYNDNGGVIVVGGKISVQNSLANMVNDGTITAYELETAGGGSFQNNAEVNITGPTTINSNQNTWVNNGEYTTKDFLYTAGSCYVVNNCRLTVTNLFKINLGDHDVNGFRMDANCGVVAQNFELAGPARIYMGSNSVFQVLNEAKMNVTISKRGYGIYGPESGDYAVFEAKNITCDNLRQRFNVTYLNNLYVVCDEHFAFGYDNLAEDLWASHVYVDGDGPNYYLENGAVLYTGGEKPGITIPKSTCNPGFGGGDDFTPVIRVMAEDLTVNDGSDFDFNDVVFDVQWTATGAKIRLNAAGGTLPLTIEGVEVHAKFAEANPGKNITTKTMMNTAENARDAYVKPIFEITGNFKNGDVNDANLIKVMVNKGTAEKPNWLELKAEKGKVAAKIGVEPKCDWCYERQDIERKYSNFAKWVRGEVETFY